MIHAFSSLLPNCCPYPIFGNDNVPVKGRKAKLRCLPQLPRVVQSSFWMLNGEFGRAVELTPLCYCLICIKIRRVERSRAVCVGIKRQPAHCVYPEGAKELEKRGRTAREQTQPPRRMKTFSSIHFASKGLSVFPFRSVSL